MTENYCKTNNQPKTCRELCLIARGKNIKNYKKYTKKST